MTLRHPTRLPVLVCLAGLTLAGACGVRGDLVPAPPVFGEARRDHEAREAREAERKRAQDRARQQQQQAPAAQPDPATPAPSAPESR